MESAFTMAEKLKYVADVAANERTVDEFRRRYVELYYELTECLRLLQALGRAQIAWQRRLPGYRMPGASGLLAPEIACASR